MNLKSLRELQDLMTRIESFNSEELNEYDNFKISIETKFTNSSDNPDPEYAKVGDSGFDLRAYLLVNRLHLNLWREN